MRTLRRLPVFLSHNYNLLLALAVFGTMVGLAAVSGYWLLYRASYLFGCLIALSFLWGRANLRRLSVSVERSQDRLQVGQQAEARVRVSNSSFYPKLWLEIEDPTDMPGLPARTVITLPAHAHRTWRANIPCTRRGLYNLGPLTITTGDPFGLFRFRRRFGAAHSLLVYPLPEELPYFWAPPAHLPGEGTQRKRTHYVTPNAASIRDYQPGDSYNRIHWRSTARLRRLMVKTFEMDPSSDIWLLLDLEERIHCGSGEDSSEEYGVRAACSIANKFLDSNRPVGFLAYGQEHFLLEPARGSQQYNRLLEALALVRASGRVSLAQLLEEESRRFGRHSTLILVTPNPDEDWVTSLQSLVQRGARAAVVLLDASSFTPTRARLSGPSQSALLAYSTLVASDILTYLVRRGDALSLALGPDGGPADVQRPLSIEMR